MMTVWNRHVVRVAPERTDDMLRVLGRTMDLHGVCQSSVVQLTGGAFLTGFLLSLGAQEVLIGIAASFPLFVKLSQLYTSWRIELSGQWWRTAIYGAVVGRLPLFAAALIPFLDIPQPLALWLLMAVLAITSLGGAIWEIAFLTWMAELIPIRLRGGFWGKRTRVSELTGIVVAVIASLLFDRWHAGNPDSTTGFGIVFGVAAILATIAIYFLYRMPVPPTPPQKTEPGSLIATLTRPTRDENFRRLLVFIGIWGFGVGLVGPFSSVFMLREMNLSFVHVTVLTIIPSALIALAQPYWGRLTDHFGSKPVLRSATYIIAISTSLWLLTTPERTWPILILQIVGGFGWAAYHISINNLVLKLAPPASRSSYAASMGALFAVTQACSPIVGGLLLTGLQELGIRSILTYHILFGLSALLRILATPLLGGIEEKGGAHVGHMITVMGRLRSMGAIGGIGTIFDFTYTYLGRIADFITREHKGIRRKVRLK